MSRPSSELAHLFRALKAPAAARALPKLADRARHEEWSFEQFAAALLKTETDSRDSHGGQSRIKAARFPARKTIEEFDFAFQASLRRDTVLHLGQLDFLAGRENIVLLGPPGTGQTHLAVALGIRACLAGQRTLSRPPPNPPTATPPRAADTLRTPRFQAETRRRGPRRRARASRQGGPLFNRRVERRVPLAPRRAATLRPVQVRRLSSRRRPAVWATTGSWPRTKVGGS